MTNKANQGRNGTGTAAWLSAIVGGMSRWTDEELVALLDSASSLIQDRARVRRASMDRAIQALNVVAAETAPEAYGITGKHEAETVAINRPPEGFSAFPALALPEGFQTIVQYLRGLAFPAYLAGKELPKGWPTVKTALWQAVKKYADPMQAWEAAQAKGITAAYIAGKAGQIASWASL